jgi:hypothetical protein
MAKPPKKAVNTAKAMYDAHWKKDSTALNNFVDSIGPAMKRQLRSGNEASIDSARSTFGVLKDKFKDLGSKYPDKSMIKK